MGYIITEPNSTFLTKIKGIKVEAKWSRQTAVLHLLENIT